MSEPLVAQVNRFTHVTQHGIAVRAGNRSALLFSPGSENKKGHDSRRSPCRIKSNPLVSFSPFLKVESPLLVKSFTQAPPARRHAL